MKSFLVIDKFASEGSLNQSFNRKTCKRKTFDRKILDRPMNFHDSTIQNVLLLLKHVFGREIMFPAKLKFNLTAFL